MVGTAAPLGRDDIDTDQIIPSEFLKVVEKRGIGRYLFYRWRYNEDGSENDGFVLNKPLYRSSTILLAGSNFGIGSSRENAVWSILDSGVKCVIARSFGDIFQNNAARNGLLCVKVEGPTLALLKSMAEQGVTFEVDVQAQEVKAGQVSVSFELDHHAKSRLLEDHDEVALTLGRHEGALSAYEGRMPSWADPEAK